jgi:diguanylate cyclase (GGDEF)-like protein
MRQGAVSRPEEVSVTAGVHERVHGRVLAVRAWQLWALPRWLVCYVLAVVAVYAVAIGVAASSTSWPPRDLAVFGLLLACSAASVELTRRAGENAGLIKDVFGVWELPVAILLPPMFALIAPICRIALQQWRIRRTLPHRRVFSAAAIGLSLGAASVTFHSLAGPLHATAPGGVGRAVAWSLLAVLCAVVNSVTNKVLIGIVVKGSDPAAHVTRGFFRREPLYNDLAEMCIAVVIAYGVMTNLFVAVFALPFVTLLQRSLRHDQLVHASRMDSKTGLLNAATWEREAATQVARAARTRTPLAVALVDIDHFKAVNDTYGHLVGDRALREIGDAFKLLLRDYDLVGRFGGEEFVLLLPQTRGHDAYRIAERIRTYIAGAPIRAPVEPGAIPVRVTVSIGVAALDSYRRDLTELLAAADGALYRAKQAGRNQVHMVTSDATGAGDSAVAPPAADEPPPRDAAR